MSANTIGADVNEILTGFYLVGGKWSSFGNGAEAKAQLVARKAQLAPNEYVDQEGRAKAMANSVLAWAASNGYAGKVVKAWWTARPGVLSAAYGQPVDSRMNPTDILLQFSDGQFLGISAKSTKSSGDIGFKNPGAGTVSKALGIDLDSLFKTRTAVVIKKLKLPIPMQERKAYIRSKPKVQQQTVLVGQQILASMRDKMFEKLSTMKPKDLRAYILKYWMDADVIEPRYIKVTGNGKNGAYAASVMDPLNNEKLQALSSPKLTVMKVGADSVGIIGGNNKKIMKMRFKYESEKVASSLKLSGDPW